MNYLEEEISSCIQNNSGNGCKMENVSDPEINLSTVFPAFVNEKFRWCHENILFMMNVTRIIMMVTGILGNASAFYMLQFRSKPTPTKTLLKVLCLSDLVFLLSSIIRIILLENRMKCSTFTASLIRDFILRFVRMFAKNMCIWLTVLLGMFRAIAVCQPFSAAKRLHGRSCWLSISVVMVMTLLTESLLWFQRGMRMRNRRSEHGKLQCYSSRTTDWGKTEFMKYYEGFFLNLILNFLVPFVVLMVCNCLLVREIMRKRQQKNGDIVRHQKDSWKQVSTEVTKAVVVISSLFLISYSVHCAYGTKMLSESFNSYINGNKCRKKFFSVIANMTISLNSSFSFLPYYVMRKSFRARAKRLFCKICSCNGNGWYYYFKSEASSK